MSTDNIFIGVLCFYGYVSIIADILDYSSGYFRLFRVFEKMSTEKPKRDEIIRFYEHWKKGGHIGGSDMTILFQWLIALCEENDALKQKVGE